MSSYKIKYYHLGFRNLRFRITIQNRILMDENARFNVKLIIWHIKSDSLMDGSKIQY